MEKSFGGRDFVKFVDIKQAETFDVDWSAILLRKEVGQDLNDEGRNLIRGDVPCRSYGRIVGSTCLRELSL